jgi:hypothetical protein
MDNVMTIRIIAGIVAVILVAVIIGRRKRMATARRISARR